jgi:integrase
MSERLNWSRKSLTELEQSYWDRIAPAREGDGYDSTTDRPSYQWLTDHGFSGLAYALREHHDLTVKQFFTDVVGLGAAEEAPEYDWSIADVETAKWLSKFVESRMRRVEEGKRTESTVTTKRSRLATYARTYESIHGDAPLVDEVRDPTQEADAYDRALTVFREMQLERESEASVVRYHEAVHEWYEFLANRRLATFNPVTGIESKHGLDLSRESREKPALSAAQVGGLAAAANSTEERLLVVALAGVGLRRSEVAALHVSQIRFGDDPRIVFEERKNGPGQVSLLYGEQVIAERIDELAGDVGAEDGDDTGEWSGYLFPSRASATGHVTGETVNNRFQRLCDRAGVELEGETPTSHACRRFWYRSYQSAMSGLLEMMSEAAADQGAASAEVVVQEYLDEESRREYRQHAMREALAAAFEETPSATAE